MSRELHPNQEDSFLEIGRLIHENSYLRQKKEILTRNMKIDLIKKKDGNSVVGEIKKSSRFLLPSKMQLLFYLYRLKEMGVEVKGEILVPKERKRERVYLTDDLKNKLKVAIQEVKEIIAQYSPPPPVKISFCGKCAYNEFCWAEV